MTQYLKLENDLLVVRVAPRGAELRNIKDKFSEREILWSGDPKVWSGVAPILFPVVGRLRTGGFRHRGRFYPMPIHGFAAGKKFSLVRHNRVELILELHDCAQTRAVYPFAFCLQVTFSLEAQVLSVAYQVKNTGSDTMYFSIGSHPAFALPGATMEKSEAEVLFDRLERPYCHRIRNGLLSEAGPVDLDGQCLRLHSGTFENDAIIFSQVRSSYIQILSGGKQLVVMNTGGLPYLGLWAKPNAPFICVEPWLTPDDTNVAPENLAQKPGFQALASREIFRCGYQIFC
ncbi:aldose 1-epimerase family protein [Microbulbifer sp. TYP-18]|uniref:aldose 1-epimerase family protein n=1 Tax=Microbulbifer sp. TYP-18 TaxID=3230024 RepID=UPI0034C698BA